LAVDGGRLLAVGFRLPSPQSRFPAVGFRLPAVGSRLLAVGCWLPSPDSRAPSPESRVPTLEHTSKVGILAGSLQLEADSRLPAAYNSILHKMQIDLRPHYRLN